MARKRKCGVLMHVSSLWSETSIGDFGSGAVEWIDFLAECGFGVWQTLPFCLPDKYRSPYMSFSAFSLNYNFISPEILRVKGLITDEEYSAARQHTPYVCEYDRLDSERFALLRKAAARMTDRTAVQRFMETHPYTEQFCRFMALREANGGKTHDKWTVTEYDSELYYAWCFTQYEFMEQWQAVKRYANDRGVEIVGDIPIYVAYDSADVYFNPHMFQLDSEGRQSASAGCPPDYFSEDGQMWGNPLYDWSKMKKDGYGWWCARMSLMTELFDRVRIDHFRGLASYWSIPASAKSAKEGKWVKGPGRALIDALKKVAPEGSIIAEDLGEITPDVKKLLEYSGFPGMRVLQFGFIGDTSSEHIPFNYPANCVAYTGTHDNDTLLSFIFEMDKGEQRRLYDYVSYSGDKCEECCRYVIRELCRSHADTVILPIQDILIYGTDTRMNVPGRATGNWAIRLEKKQLDGVDRKRYRDMLRLYGR